MLRHDITDSDQLSFYYSGIVTLLFSYLTTAIGQSSVNHPGDVDVSRLLVPPYCCPLTDREFSNFNNLHSYSSSRETVQCRGATNSEGIRMRDGMRATDEGRV